MTKRPSQYKEAFKKGLRQSSNPRNQDRLARCSNAKPTREGLFGWKEIPQLVAQSLVAFPFPQLLAGREQILLAYADQFYQVDPISGTQTLLDTVDAYTGLSAFFDLSGGVWHFVDLGKMFILVNGVGIVFRDNTTFDYSLNSPVKVATDVKLSSMCEWRGRIFSAGFMPSMTWKSGWQDIFAAYRSGERVPDDLRSMDFLIDENFVLWSSIGRADFSFRWLLYPDEAMSGILSEIGGVSPLGYTGNKTPLQEALMRAELGMIRVPFKGQVLCVKPHSKGVIVYGTDGIALLYHSQQPFSTFGLKVLSFVGIAGRGAVGGSEDVHLFVDTTGKLCLLNSNAEITCLDYEEFFAPFLTKEIVVSYRADTLKPEFYISTETKSFVLTTGGLGEIWQSITSTGSFQGNQIVVSKNQQDRSLQVETSDFDGGLTGALKQAQSLRLSSNQSSGVLGSSAVSYQGGSFIYTRPRLFSPDGFLVLHDTGSLSRLCVSSDKAEGVILEQLDVESDFLSKQIVRAAYGYETEQQAD